MGKGNGEHPPQKFINDQCFCQLFIMGFMGVSITLSSLSAGQDDGGTFPYPYFFTGFILGPILLVNLISRWAVVNAVQKKGLTRNNIVEVLNKTTWGNVIWPWSCKVGMLWCIPGSILTGIGGVNCGIEEKEDGNKTIRNSCYFDIEGDRGEMYKGLAIGLLVIHVLSFVYLLLSNCPVHSVLDQIKEDPRRNTVAPARRAPAAQAPAVNTSASTTSQAANNSLASPPPTYSDVTNQAATGGGQSDIEMKALKKQLDERAKEIERREREVSERERQVREVNTLPPPPSYNDIINHV